MSTVSTSSFLNIIRVATALAIGLTATVAANAVVITANTSGFSQSGGAGFSLGQSVTTPTGGPWDHISFNLVRTDGQAFATGPLYLLSNAYTGTASALSTSTPSFIAVAGASNITAGAWTFDPSVTLNSSTQYFFYMGGVFDGTSQILFSNSNAYSSGIASQGGLNDPFLDVQPADLQFSLKGTPVATAVPEPAAVGLMLAGLAVVGGGAARRRKLIA